MHSLKFGDFENMNDIAEANREVFGMVNDRILYKVLSEYHSISFTLDKPSKRGFSIDPLWGHYAQKGNGVCLVFDKNAIFRQAKAQYGDKVKIASIKYLSDYSGTIFTEGRSEENVRKYIANNIDDIFFTKTIDWKYESEIRILVREKDKVKNLYFDESTLVAAILCLPHYDDYKESAEYKLLKAVLPNKPILHYTTQFGNKELFDEDGNKMCNIIGLDVKVDA